MPGAGPCKKNCPMKKIPIPKALFSGRIALAAKAIISPAGAIPTRPKIRTEIKLAVVQHSNRSDNTEKVKQTKTIRSGLPERSAI